MKDMNLKRKVVLVTGVVNERSIAFEVAQAFADAGARVFVSCQTVEIKDKMRPKLLDVAEDVTYADLTSEEDVARLVGELPDQVDVVFHSAAYAPREMLQGSGVASFRMDGFATAMLVSAGSFMLLVQSLQQKLTEGSSIIAMTHLGAERAFPNYNVMGPAKAALNSLIRLAAYDLGPRGIRCNGIAAGPILTMAARAIQGSRQMVALHEDISPLRRPTTPKDVAGTALYLASELAWGITGEILNIDNGYSILGVTAREED